MTEIKINQIAMVANLVSSIFESVNHLALNTDNSTLQQDTALALDAIDKPIKELFPNDFEVLSISSLKASLNEQITAETIAVSKQWHDNLLGKLGGLLSNELLSHEELTTETASALLLHILDTDYEMNMKCTLLLHASLSCGFSLPLESFDVILSLFAEMPDLLVNNQTHPNYVYREAEQKTFECCPTCEGEGHPYYTAFSYLMNNFDNPFLPAKLWMKCEDCGNLYTFQFPNSHIALTENYKQIEPVSSLSSISSSLPHALSIWCDILKHAMTYLDCGRGGYENLSGLDLLEVGVGSGELLAVALELGCLPDAVEIDADAAQTVANILNLPVWNCDFLKFHADKQYSMIVMGDVIEHVTNPRMALQKAHDLLKDDGVLWLSTPNFEGSFTRMRKFSDAMWKEPYHITYFSYNGFKTLAEQCGFVIREYSVSGRYRGSMELYLTKKH